MNVVCSGGVEIRLSGSATYLLDWDLTCLVQNLHIVTRTSVVVLAHPRGVRRIKICFDVAYCGNSVLHWWPTSPVWIAVRPVAEMYSTWCTRNVLSRRPCRLAIDIVIDPPWEPVEAILVVISVNTSRRERHLVYLFSRSFVSGD